MIYSGSDLKFKVEATLDGFSMEDDDFNIVIKNKWGQIKFLVRKDDCFRDDNGGYYFTLEDVSSGTYFAYFTAHVPDDDYLKHIRNVVHKKFLYTVNSCGCHIKYDECDCPQDCECHDGLKVVYKQFWTVNIDGEVYLVDKNGGYILTSEGNRIKFLKSE